MSVQSQPRETKHLDEEQSRLNHSLVASAAERRHRSRLSQRTDSASTATKTSASRAMNQTEQSDTMAGTTSSHSSYTRRTRHSQPPNHIPSISFETPLRPARTSDRSPPRRRRSPSPYVPCRSARVPIRREPNNLLWTIKSPHTDSRDHSGLPLHMAHSASSTHQIHYYSPTESAARALYPSGVARPLIAQRNVTSARNKANANKYLCDKYPGDVPVPFGYRCPNQRGRSDGCWFDDGVVGGGLEAGVKPRKCFVKRMIKKVKDIVRK